MVVNDKGEILADSPPPSGEEQSVGTNEVAAIGGEQAAESSDPVPISKEHEEFLNYTKRIRKIVAMPNPADPEFCHNMRAFIESRGDGMASSDQLLEAHKLFQDNCVEKKKEKEEADAAVDASMDEAGNKLSDTPTSNFNIPSLPEEQQSDAEVPANKIIDEYLGMDKKLSTFDDNLGQRPNSGKTSDDKEYQIKKVNGDKMFYFLVILGVAAMVYAVSKKE